MPALWQVIIDIYVVIIDQTKRRNRLNRVAKNKQMKHNQPLFDNKKAIRAKQQPMNNVSDFVSL